MSMTPTVRLDQGYDVQSLNPWVSGATDDVYVTWDGKVFIHPCGTTDIIITTLAEADDHLGYPLASLTFDPATDTGRQIIAYWLEAHGLTFDSPTTH